MKKAVCRIAPTDALVNQKTSARHPLFRPDTDHSYSVTRNAACVAKRPHRKGTQKRPLRPEGANTRHTPLDGARPGAESLPATTTAESGQFECSVGTKRVRDADQRVMPAHSGGGLPSGPSGFVDCTRRRCRLTFRSLRRGGRAVEGARLESVYTVTPYRGFESLPLRQILEPGGNRAPGSM